MSCKECHQPIEPSQPLVDDEFCSYACAQQWEVERMEGEGGSVC